jgi:hypothetical protein
LATSGDRIELAHMPEREAAQERPERRRRIDVGEQPGHAAVPQQVHVLDAVRASDHARDQSGHLRPGMRTTVARHRQMLVHQMAQTGPVGQREHRHQPSRGHQTWIVEPR